MLCEKPFSKSGWRTHIWWVIITRKKWKQNYKCNKSINTQSRYLIFSPHHFLSCQIFTILNNNRKIYHEYLQYMYLLHCNVLGIDTMIIGKSSCHNYYYSIHWMLQLQKLWHVVIAYILLNKSVQMKHYTNHVSLYSHFYWISAQLKGFLKLIQSCQ